jgi:hypothetical protein
MKLKLKNVRLSFPHLFVPTAFKPGDPPKFKATLLVAKDDPQAQVIENAIKAVAKEKWGAKADAILKSIRGNPNKFCYQDGDDKAYDGYADCMALTAGNKTRPLVIDADKSLLVEADGKPYAGCYVNVSIELFTYDNSGNGISASLGGVQFYRDGDAFVGGGAASEDEFDDLTAGATAEDLV